jgi:hypothetical protein
MDEDDAKINSVVLENGSKVSMQKGDTVMLVLDFETSGNDTCKISLYDTAKPNTPVYTETKTLSSGSSKLEIPLSYEKDASQVHMMIKFTSTSGTTLYESIYFDLTYTTSIWSNPALYGAIIVVVILVIALVVYKSRMAPKKEKNTLTFEQIEAEKQAQKNAAATQKKEEKKPSAAKSERQRYLASKKKKE